MTCSMVYVRLIVIQTDEEATKGGGHTEVVTINLPLQPHSLPSSKMHHRVHGARVHRASSAIVSESVQEVHLGIVHHQEHVGVGGVGGGGGGGHEAVGAVDGGGEGAGGGVIGLTLVGDHITQDEGRLRHGHVDIAARSGVETDLCLQAVCGQRQTG